MFQYFIKQYRQFIIIGAGLGVILLVLFLGLFGKSHDEPYLDTFNSMSSSHTKESNTLSQESNIKQNTKQSTAKIYIDVKGAVNHPGVYKIRPDDRIETAIALAGGTNIFADLNQVNLAQRLNDQQIVYIPKQGEKIPAQFLVQMEVNNENKTSDMGSSQTDIKQVNLNKASKEDLQTLTGVGPSKAEAIIQYRQTHGGFKSIEDLKQVDGIGDKTFIKLKPFISV